MKLLRPYLRQHRRTIVTYALFCGVFTVSFCLYQLPLSAVAYPMALCALAGLGILTWDFLRVREKHRELTAMQAHSKATSASGVRRTPAVAMQPSMPPKTPQGPKNSPSVAGKKFLIPIQEPKCRKPVS